MTIEFDGSLFGTDAPVLRPVECPPPGVYYDIPAQVYHSWSAVSSTLLKNYAKRPSTSRTPYEPGDDANMGSGIHAYTLQGQAGLEVECLIMPMECDGRSKSAHAAREICQDRNPGKVLLPPVYGPLKIPAMEVIKGVDGSLRLHPKIGPILRNSQKEVSLVWIDKETQVLCKARLDIWDGAVIWDLKKTRSLAGFGWQMKDLHYDVQAGFYYEGAVACGLPVVGFGFIPVEAVPPYEATIGYADPEKMDERRMNALRLLGLVKQSKLTDRWPNYQIPAHVFDLDDLTPDDLVQVW